MRKSCCFCIPILRGATTLGIISVILCTFQLAMTIPYLVDIDVNIFNPLKSFLIWLEDGLKQHGIDAKGREDVMKGFQKYSWIIILCETVCTCCYFLISFLMVCGIQCDKRGLMIPYLVVQFFYMILTQIIEFAVTCSSLVFLLFSYFYLEDNYKAYFEENVGHVIAFLIMMAVATISVGRTISFLTWYFWKVVKRAYVELGKGDWNSYSMQQLEAYNNLSQRNEAYFNNGSDIEGRLYPKVP